MTAVRILALIAGVTSACDILPRPGDTEGLQQAGRWEQHGRIIVEPDPRYTIVHLRVDTNVLERHDVLLARFDFDPSEAAGDEYSLSIALDLRSARPPAPHTRLFVGAVLAPLAAQSGRTAKRPHDRPTIDTIIIVNRNIFDTADAAPDWVANLANGLHVRTRPWVIRRRLLLNPGDSFDSARVEESERMLRTLGVFRFVRVDTIRSGPGDKLALRAVTSD